MKKRGRALIVFAFMALGFALVALVLASALIGSNRLALGLLLFFVLVIFYGWPFLISALGAGDRER